MGEKKRGLTVRQQQVLQALRDGLSVKEIAALLKISARTVRGHIEVLKQKYSARTREQLVARAPIDKNLPPENPSGGRDAEEKGFTSGST